MSESSSLMNSREPTLAAEAVLKRSGELPVEEQIVVDGYDFNQGINYERILQSFKRCGFQATNFDRAVNEIRRMVNDISSHLFSRMEQPSDH